MEPEDLHACREKRLNSDAAKKAEMYLKCLLSAVGFQVWIMRALSPAWPAGLMCPCSRKIAWVHSNLSVNARDDSRKLVPITGQTGREHHTSLADHGF